MAKEKGTPSKMLPALQGGAVIVIGGSLASLIQNFDGGATLAAIDKVGHYAPIINKVLIAAKGIYDLVVANQQMGAKIENFFRRVVAVNKFLRKNTKDMPKEKLPHIDVEELHGHMQRGLHKCIEINGRGTLTGYLLAANDAAALKECDTGMANCLTYVQTAVMSYMKEQMQQMKDQLKLPQS